MSEDLARAVCQAMKTWPGCKLFECVAPCELHEKKPTATATCWRRALWIAEACEAVIDARDGKGALIETIPNSDEPS